MNLLFYSLDAMEQPRLGKALSIQSSALPTSTMTIKMAAQTGTKIFPTQKNDLTSFELPQEMKDAVGCKRHCPHSPK